MALANIDQPDFGAGIHRGREAPPNAAYDAVNYLIDDQGQPFGRAGTAYHSSSDAGVTLSRIATGSFPGPATDRVLTWGTKLYVINGGSPLELWDSGSFVLGRPVSVGGVMVWPYKQDVSGGNKYSQVLVYGGSLLPAGGDGGGGTITATAGSTAVTKTGGSTWVGAVDAGMLVTVGTSRGLVKSVDGADALTLVYPFGGATVTTTNYLISALQALVVGSALPTGIPASDSLVLGSSGQRLLVGVGNRVYVADRSTSGPIFSFDPAIYHEIPGVGDVTGIEGLGDNAAVFTASGMWRISNLSLDVVDAFGNIQQAVERTNGEIALWGENGITAWAGGIVIPALDDVYIAGLDGSAVTITGDAENEKVRRLYRSYTKTAGYRPGGATVHRGHLFLPIVNGSTVVDVLVCRLDRSAAWTRWAGHAACSGYAVLAASVSSASKLLGVAGVRVADLTGCLDTGSSLDADSTTSDLVLITRDYPTGQQPGFFKNARVRYELTSADPGTDAFTRGNGAIGNGWLPWLDATQPEIVSNAATTGGFYADTTRPETVGPDGFVEAIFTAPLTPSSAEAFGVGFRLTAHTASSNGYAFEIADIGGTFRPRLYKGSAFTTVATGTNQAGSIDGIRLVVAGSTLTGYFRIAGVWTQVVTATDTTYPAAGFVGFFVQDPTTSVTSVSWTPSVPSVALAFSSDQDAGVFTTLTEKGQQGGGSGWVASDGSKYQWALVAKKRERARFRITVTGASASFVLRSIGLMLRQSGKQ